ncbi:hypothetical protein RRG08_037768 [Elysia crispata]|uniref:Fibrinogen C-terminal domain-containing protein n=1 Tax=Elysia crispata TaxID=231223 RepID=A0AAE1A993_9GAST|nr:hypothetical protein RRG08_037768 [Elysia crispata]
MERSLCIIIALCSVICCYGLDLTLEGDTPTVPGVRSLCGVLICDETINASVSSSSGNDNDGSSVVLDSITSMSVFRIDSTISKLNAKNKRKILIGSVTSQTPTLTQVANGRKVDGLLKARRATVRVELVKQEDCQAEFTCQVRGSDNQGREVVSSTSLVQHQGQKGNQLNNGIVMPGMSLQLFALVQQLVSQSMGGLGKKIENLEDRIGHLQKELTDNIGLLQKELNDNIRLLQREMSDKGDSLENRMEDRIGQLQRGVTDRVGLLQKEVSANIGLLQKEVSANIGLMQTDFNDRTDSFERRLNTKLDFLENRVEDKIDNNNNLNKLIQLDSKVSTELAQFRTETKTDIMNSLNTLRQSFQQAQGEAIKNFSETFDKTLNYTSDLLSSMTSDFDILKMYGKENLYTVRNETETIREILTSGKVSSQCLRNDTTTSVMDHLPVICERDMGVSENKTFPKNIVVPQSTIQRDILCDTQTYGGGWTVIQRRTKGDVYFNRDWESYKNGFGEPDGDFWLGNEAVHILTYVQPYELRIEIRSDGKDYFAHYKTFKVESESDKYRLRLGAVSGTLGGGSYGLSYSNNMFFTTFDRDNDESSSNCALSGKFGWWHKICYLSKLNAPWINKQISDSWHSGQKWMSATRTEMKMRPL